MSKGDRMRARMANRMARRLGGLCTLAVLATSLPGCVSMVLTGVASAGIAASEERGLGGALTDTRIRTDINGKWLNASMDILQKVNLSVQEGRVLLSGSVPTPEMRLEAVKLVWQVEGVREVANEITVGEGGGGATNYARDVWIATQLRSDILFDRAIQSVNYSIEAVDGTVFLMGVAQNQAELDRVANYARNLRYVKRVVSYVRIKDRPAPPGGATTQATTGRGAASPASTSPGPGPAGAPPPPAAVEPPSAPSAVGGVPGRAPVDTAPLSGPGGTS
jgi:osmotically-inducible protein OsmY